MATFHEMTGADGAPVVRCYVKGAPDVLIARARLVPAARTATIVPITDDNRAPRRWTPTTGSPRPASGSWSWRSATSTRPTFDPTAT